MPRSARGSRTIFVALVLSVRHDAAAAFRMTSLAVAMRSPLAWPANFVLALPSVRRLVAPAREGDWPSRAILTLVALATLTTSGAFLDRTATERLPGLRPWGVLGLLLLVVEFSSPRERAPVRSGTAPG